jgi:phosphorylcholine metabolism protein LicD
LFYKIEDSYYYSASFFGLCNSKPEKYCKFSNHIRGFSKVEFKNELYNVPENSDEFLTEWYGNWRIPKQFNYFQGLAGEFKNLIN